MIHHGDTEDIFFYIMGGRGPEARAKSCFRFGVAALLPKQTENNIILAGLRPTGTVEGGKLPTLPHQGDVHNDPIT